MEEEIKKIFEARDAVKEARDEFENMVRQYIKDHVFPTDRSSIEAAILDLPECESKLFLYDMIWDLDHPKEEV